MRAVKKIRTGRPSLPVVGVGASAGGLDAFKKFLKSVPENSGVAYVLVQHLDPKHKSQLPDLLQRTTKVPVMQISDAITIEPNRIYTIPSNKILTAKGGVLQLTPRPGPGKSVANSPIDHFFKSLADVYQSQAIGVILSGTGADGTEGLRTIKEHGGLT